MTSFGSVLHGLRVCYFGKQRCLAADVGCTEAAISFWESGRRLPSSHLLGLLVKRVRKAGATPVEVEELVTAYRAAIVAARCNDDI